MTNKREILSSLGIREGVVIDCYYGNGSFARTSTIDRISDYFVFVNPGNRESHNSVIRYIKKGIWRLKN